MSSLARAMVVFDHYLEVIDDGLFSRQANQAAIDKRGHALVQQFLAQGTFNDLAMALEFHKSGPNWEAIRDVVLLHTVEYLVAALSLEQLRPLVLTAPPTQLTNFLIQLVIHDQHKTVAKIVDVFVAVHGYNFQRYTFDPCFVLGQAVMSGAHRSSKYLSNVIMRASDETIAKCNTDLRRQEVVESAVYNDYGRILELAAAYPRLYTIRPNDLLDLAAEEGASSVLRALVTTFAYSDNYVSSAFQVSMQLLSIDNIAVLVSRYPDGPFFGDRGTWINVIESLRLEATRDVIAFLRVLPRRAFLWHERGGADELFELVATDQLTDIPNGESFVFTVLEHMLGKFIFTRPVLARVLVRAIARNYPRVVRLIADYLGPAGLADEFTQQTIREMADRARMAVSGVNPEALALLSPEQRRFVQP